MPETVVDTLPGGLVTVRSYTEFGDLETIEEPYEPMVTYDTNGWGLPKTIKIDGEAVQTLFGARDTL